MLIGQREVFLEVLGCLGSIFVFLGVMDSVVWLQSIRHVVVLPTTCQHPRDLFVVTHRLGGKQITHLL